MRQDLSPSEPSSGEGSATGIPPEIPDFPLLTKIGEGSFGEVWLSKDACGHFCAVKTVFRGKFPNPALYQREFEGIRRFTLVSKENRHLIEVRHVGRGPADDFFHYAMELADDENASDETEGAESLRIKADTYIPRTLSRLLRDKRARPRSGAKDPFGLPAVECLEIAIALSSALAHLHKPTPVHPAGLVHCDIKPSNVIFVDGKPKLADIGLVSEPNSEAPALGTPGYMPRAGGGEKQGDIYALGKLLYEMITGFSKDKYPSLPAGWDEAPEFPELKELNDIVMRACQPARQRRYQTADEMHRDFRELKSKRELRSKRAVRRLKWAVGSAAAIIVALLWAKHSGEQTHSRKLGVLLEVQLAHSGPQEVGWFSNDWARLQGVATGGRDKEVLEQAAPLLAGIDARPLNMYSGASNASAAFSADGRVILGGSGQGFAMLMETNGMSSSLVSNGEGPVCWGLDNKRLQLVASSNYLALVEADTGKDRAEFTFPNVEATAAVSPTTLAVTPDGSRVAAARGNRLFVWQSFPVKMLGEIPGYATALAFSSDGSLLAAGNADGKTRVYSIPGLVQVALMPPAERGGPIVSLAFTLDRTVRYGFEKHSNSWLLATGDQGADIVVWDIAGRLPISFCRGSTWVVKALAFSPDGQILASAGKNAPCLWEASTGKLLLRLSGTSSGPSSALAFDNSGRRLVCGGTTGPVDGAVTVLWDIETDRGIQCLRGLDSPIRKVWVSPDSRWVAALADNWRLGVWEVASGWLRFVFETPVGGYADSAGGCFDANDKTFAFATGQEACVYDLATGDVLQRWHLAEGESDQLRFDAKGRLLLLRAEEDVPRGMGRWRLYELARDGIPVRLLEQKDPSGQPVAVAFPAGAEKFLVWDWGPLGTKRVIRAHAVDSGRELWRMTTETDGWGLGVALDSAGKWVAYRGNAGCFRLTRLTDFVEVDATVKNYTAISPSGQDFAGGGWFLPGRDGVDRRIPLPIDEHPNAMVSAFTPDGKRLVAGTEQGVVLLVDIKEVQRRLAGFR